MLDTVGLKRYYTSALTEVDLRLSGGVRLNNRKIPTWAINPKKGERYPRITVLFTPNNIMHVLAEISMPKMLFGHNSRLPTESEIFSGLELLENYVSSKLNLNFDSRTALVNLVHFTRDITCPQSEIFPVIRNLAGKSIAKMSKMLYDDKTLYFSARTKRPKAKQIRIYSKLDEVLSRPNPSSDAITDAREKLRIEYCFKGLNTMRTLANKLKLPNIEARTLLSEYTANAVMSSLLQELDFKTASFDEKSTLDRLFETFRPRRARELLGFLELIKHRGVNFYKDPSLGISPHSYYRLARDCRKAKVSI